MISARTARIDDNLGTGTEGSNPLPSSEESAANFAHLMLSKLDQFGGGPPCTLTAAYSNLSSTTVDEQLDTGDVRLVPRADFWTRYRLGEPPLKAIKAFIASQRRPAHETVSRCLGRVN